jgi:hypothetical protein
MPRTFAWADRADNQRTRQHLTAWAFLSRLAGLTKYSARRVLVSFIWCDGPPVREAYEQTGSLGT